MCRSGATYTPAPIVDAMISDRFLVAAADGRVMAIECKVSNSTVNSFKRLVHDTGGKAAHWYNQLGRAQVVPCAVLSGVYATANLMDVQEKVFTCFGSTA